MFFITYLRRELRRRMRQAIFIALGLAVGVGLVITVTAASAGVRNAQAGVLKGLYGVGTDVTVTAKTQAGSASPPSGPGSGKGSTIQIGPVAPRSAPTGSVARSGPGTRSRPWPARSLVRWTPVRYPRSRGCMA